MEQLHTGIFGKSLIRDLRARGYSPASLVGNTGINLRLFEAEEPRVPFDGLATLFERAAELTGDDLIGFRHAQNSDYRELGLIAFTGVSSPDVRSLLHTLARYQRINSDVLRINSDRLDIEGLLEWHYQVPRSVVRRQFIEFNAAGLVHVLRRLTDRRLAPEDLGFRHFRKTGLDEMSGFFGRAPRLGETDNRLCFRPQDLDLPLKTSDHLLNRLLTKYSDDALVALAAGKPSFVNTVEEQVAKDPAAPQSVIAAQMGMSERTLARRLAAEGATFLKVLEGYRKAMATTMLRDSDLQITEIAFVVGYSDLSTFSTAFKRWTGRKPSAYRAAGDG